MPFRTSEIRSCPHSDVRSAAVDAVKFIPDDLACTVAGLNYLQTVPGKALTAAVTRRLAQEKTIAVADVALWRREHPECAVPCAIAISQCRLKGADKFPGKSNELWAVPEALQQATSARVAAYKAQRIAELAQPKIVLDLCCGIGGDMLALSRIAPVLAMDISMVRVWMAHHNALVFPEKYRVMAVQGDLQNFPVHLTSGIFVHMDPARRSDGKRNYDFSATHPAPSVLLRILEKAYAGVIKLSPAVNFSTLPTGHLELISENGTVVQALLWTGSVGTKLGENKRTATVIDRRTTWSICESSTDCAPPELHAYQPEKWLYEIDGAVTRSGLAVALAKAITLRWLSPDGGYMTGPQYLHHPALAAFEVHDHFAYTESELFKKLKHACTKYPPAVGTIEVKTRGGLGLNTDQLQKQLSKICHCDLTVLIYRCAHGKACIIARRCNKPTGG